MSQFEERVQEIVDDYLSAFQIPYSELADLESAERQDLLNTLMEEMAIAISPEDLDRLLGKADLNVEDLVSTLELGEPIDFEF